MLVQEHFITKESKERHVPTSLLSYLSSQSLKNFSWGACSSSGFSLHKSTNCLSKESWKLSNFEAIFASKSVTPSLRLLSWVKKLSHDPLRVACNFVYVCTTLPFGKTFEIRQCNKSFFGATQGEPSHSATLHHLAFYCLSNSKVAWIADINSSPFSLGRKQCAGSLWAISRKYTVGATDEQSGISLNLRTGSTGHATLFNQWEGALVFINKQIKTLVIKTELTIIFFSEEACSAFVTCIVS